MKYLFKTPLLALFALLLLTTFAAAPAYSGTTVDRINKSGELVLGTSANMPPMTAVNDKGKVVGLDIDIARLMASSMNVKLKIESMPFDKLLPALESGEVDIVISNMTMNVERNMRVAFVGPYMTSGKCILTRHEAIAKAEAAGDINVPETKIAALKGSTSIKFVEVLLPNATLTAVENHEEGVKLILDDKVGGMITDYPICMSIMQRHPDAGFVPLASLINYEPIGIALPGDDALMINITENFLKRMDGTGLFDELSVRWFGQAISGVEKK